MLSQIKVFLFHDLIYSTVNAHHVFLIHSFINRHLDCFHSLAIVSNATSEHRHTEISLGKWLCSL